ncbi:MAG: hypothetical protein ABL984_15865 [Pyrinomonadaceae bacterium]
MNLRLLAGTAAGAITLFLLGYLIWGIVLASYMKENTFQYAGLIREPPDLIVLIISNVVMAFMLAFVIEYWASARTFLGGLKVGAILGFLFALSIDIGELGYMNLYRGYAIIAVDVLGETLRDAVAGGVIGTVLGLMHRDE